MFRTRPESEPQRPRYADGYVRDAAGGAVECGHCRTRAYSRNPLILALWERAHSGCCLERQRSAVVAAVPS